MAAGLIFHFIKYKTPHLKPRQKGETWDGVLFIPNRLLTPENYSD
jgi:hypothetical protein